MCWDSLSMVHTLFLSLVELHLKNFIIQILGDDFSLFFHFQNSTYQTIHRISLFDLTFLLFC